MKYNLIRNIEDIAKRGNDLLIIKIVNYTRCNDEIIDKKIEHIEFNYKKFNEVLLFTIKNYEFIKKIMEDK